MLKKYSLIFFLLIINSLTCMEQEVDKCCSNEAPNQAVQLNKKVKSLVVLCSKAICDFLLNPQKFSNFKIDLSKLPQEIINEIDLAITHDFKSWDLVNNVRAPRYLSILNIDDKPICAVAISTNILFFVTGYKNCEAKIWDIQSGKCLNILKGHKKRIDYIKISLDNKLIITCSRDKTAKIWDLDSGNCLDTLTGQIGRVTCAAISSDNKIVVIGCFGNGAKVWDIQSHKFLHELEGHKHLIIEVKISLDNSLTLTGSEDHTARLWSLTTGKCLKVMNHVLGINAVEISSDNAFFVTGSADKTVKIWDLNSEQSLFTLIGHKSWVIYATISPDNRFVITSSFDNAVKIWSTKSGICLYTFKLEPISPMLLTVKENLCTVTNCKNTRLEIWQINFPNLQMMALNGNFNNSIQHI